VIPPAATTLVADRQDRPQPGPLGVRWIAPPHAHSTIRAGRASRGPYDTCVLATPWPEEKQTRHRKERHRRPVRRPG
jgi:hypothetical protein